MLTPIARCRHVRGQALFSLAGAFASVVLVTACSSHSSSSTLPSATPTPSATTSQPAPADQLAALATEARGRTYTATYRIVQRGKAVGTVTARVGATSYEVAITQGKATSVFLSNAKGVYSCELDQRTRVCYFVAARGKPVPPVFDPTLEHLFVDYPTYLSRDASTYDVTPAGTRPAAGHLGEVSCFAVKPTAQTPKARAYGGTYCLSSTGVFTELATQTGQLQLVSVGPAPTGRQLSPPVKPTPLPKR